MHGEEAWDSRRRMREVWAVIPARGGSKGIERKNLAPLGDRPLIAHAIDTARASQRITRILVSTEDPEIAALAEELDAEVPFARPAELARDEQPARPAIDDLVSRLASREGVAPDAVVELYPTTPFRNASDLDDAIERLEVQASVVSAVPLHVDLSKERHRGRPLTRGHEPRRLYQPTGAFVARIWLPKWTPGHPDFGGRALPDHYDSSGGLLVLEHPGARIDVDDPADLARAESFLAGAMQGGRHRVRLSTCVLGVERVARWQIVAECIESSFRVPEHGLVLVRMGGREGEVWPPSLYDLETGPLFGAPDGRIRFSERRMEIEPPQATRSIEIHHLRPVQGPCCPLAVPFSLPPLWRVDPATGRRRCLRTGSWIEGRQLEPHWIEVDDDGVQCTPSDPVG